MVAQPKGTLPSTFPYGPGLLVNTRYVSSLKDVHSAYSIPTATSVDVERIFSKGRIVLSHLRNQLSVQSTCALMCLGIWSILGYVKDRDITSVTALPDLEDGMEEEGIEDGWDMVL